MSNVTSVFGGHVANKEPIQACIAALEDALERARSGEISCVAVSYLSPDRVASYQIAGYDAGYNLIGAIEMMKADLIEAMRE